MAEQPKKFPLQRSEAEYRKSQIINEKGEYYVNYNLILNLRSQADKNPQFLSNDFEGRLHLTFTYTDQKQEDIFLNFTGNVHSIHINGKKAEINYKNRRIYLSH